MSTPPDPGWLHFSCPALPLYSDLRSVSSLTLNVPCSLPLRDLEPKGLQGLDVKTKETKWAQDKMPKVNKPLRLIQGDVGMVGAGADQRAAASPSRPVTVCPEITGFLQLLKKT